MQKRKTESWKKLGFTLVEMLIVIVIIWILAAAIIPKITGVLARARDTQRIADLKNVAMAIQNYKMDYGEYPLRKMEIWDEAWWWSLCRINYWWCDAGFWYALKDYLPNIPSDPQKNSMIKIHYHFVHKIGRWNHFFDKENNWKWWKAISPGQYLYQIFQKNWDLRWAAVLVAKVETSLTANYVLVKETHTLDWGLRLTNHGVWENDNLYGYVQNSDSKMWWAAEDINKLHLCSSVKKVSNWEEQAATANNSECSYSSEEQLYYILKV